MEEEKWTMGEKICQWKLAAKVMLIVFINHQGPLYQHFVPPKMTINNITSKSWRSSSSMLFGNAQKWRTRGSCIKIMYAHPQTVRLGQEYPENTNAELSPHSLYSLDLALRNYWPFLALKKQHRSRQFASNNEVINKAHTFLNSLPQAKFKKIR